MDKHRIRPLSTKKYCGGPVLYWMFRDQRVQDNWGLLTAQAIAEANNQPFAVIFTVNPGFRGATTRQYEFMLTGLKEVERDLEKLNIPFYILSTDKPDEVLINFIREHSIGALVSDFMPLKPLTQWKEILALRLEIPFYEVDAHNVVPTWIASPKREFGAYTLRPKLRKLWPQYLTNFEPLKSQKIPWPLEVSRVNWEEIKVNLQVDTSVKPVTWIVPGERAAAEALEDFIHTRLSGYAERRNDPNGHGQSELSPYIHFGTLSAQRIALEVSAAPAPENDKQTFLDELLVRKELSDNFCLYCPYYDSLEAAPGWARKTLEVHREDPREHLYSREELENAQTYDELWNAAQLEMVRKGKMHGYLRMYWAKKILEWSKAPEEALATCIYLNDRYFLDGRDPNGYANILWSVAGLHDRAWFDRPIFGQVRYMNYNGAKRKFNIPAYQEYVAQL